MNEKNFDPRRVHCFSSQLTDATEQPTFEEDEWWENDMDSPVFFFAVKPNFAWLIDWA